MYALASPTADRARSFTSGPFTNEHDGALLLLEARLEEAGFEDGAVNSSASNSENQARNVENIQRLGQLRSAFSALQGGQGAAP